MEFILKINSSLEALFGLFETQTAYIAREPRRVHEKHYVFSNCLQQMNNLLQDEPTK